MSINKKQTSARVAGLASGFLRDAKSSPNQKSVAASDLGQAKKKLKLRVKKSN